MLRVRRVFGNLILYFEGAGWGAFQSDRSSIQKKMDLF
jgi:hypothetical protein